MKNKLTKNPYYLIKWFDKFVNFLVPYKVKVHLIIGFVIVSVAGFITFQYVSNSSTHNTAGTIYTAKPVKIKKISTPKYVTGSPCESSQLTLSKVAEVGGDLSGQEGDIFSFTNQSNVSCTIDGYPKVVIGQFTTSGNGSLDALNDPGPAVVTLTPGLSAYFGVGWYYQNFNFGGLVKGCFNEDSIQAIPPDNNTPVSAAITIIGICPNYGSTSSIGNTTAIRLPLAFNENFTCRKMFFVPYTNTGQPEPLCPNPPQ